MRPVAHAHPRKNRPARATRALVLMILAGGCSAADNGPKGIVPGVGLGKLCHELSRGGMPVTLTLKFGDPAITEISAVTGVCAPPAGMPCTQIPVGRVPIKLYEGDKLLSSRDVILSAPAAGQPPNEYVFQPYITSTLQVAVTGGRIAPGSCQALDFPPPDGGVTDGGGDGGGAEAGAEAGAAVDAAADAGAPDASATADLAADSAAPDTAADAMAADLAADVATD